MKFIKICFMLILFVFLSHLNAKDEVKPEVKPEVKVAEKKAVTEKVDTLTQDDKATIFLVDKITR